MNHPGRVGIVSAMHEELAALLPALQGAQIQRHAGREFHTGRLGAHEVVLVLSGIGKVAAACTATLLIERYGVNRIVFTGVAGGLGEGVAVGDVVLADALLQHDLDVSPIFPRHEVPQTGLTRFATDAALNASLHAACARALLQPQMLLGDDAAALGVTAPRLHRGLVISGDQFISTTAQSQALRAELPDALAVEMEGAAMAQVCHAFGVPLAVMRVISDRADEDAHRDFGRFIEAVARRMTAGVVLGWTAQNDLLRAPISPLANARL
jgi:adenosylhomocysteine nucleosidase